MYLKGFSLPAPAQEERLIQARMAYNGGPYGYIDNIYPCGLFPQMGLRELRFQKVTILYGGNGSGKSTLLNLIAEKLGLDRVAPWNESELFGDFVKQCAWIPEEDEEGAPCRIPDGSRIIASDEVFDYMLTLRANNEEISQSKEAAKTAWGDLRFGDTVKLRGMEDYEALRMQVLSRRKSVSRRQFIRRTAGMEAVMGSNGETALSYFEEKLKNDALYCLDEPENSLSAKLQLELARMLTELSRYCGCQILLATPSPLLLALKDARVYDLDARPAGVKNWWELENIRLYYDFFQRHRGRFS